MAGYGEVPVSGKPGGKAGSGTGVGAGARNSAPQRIRIVLPLEPTTDGDSSDDDSTDSGETKNPTVNQDPLAPCMPGNEDPMG